MSFCADAALRIRAAAADRRKSEEILLSSNPLAISLALRTHVLPHDARKSLFRVRAREGEERSRVGCWNISDT